MHALAKRLPANLAKTPALGIGVYIARGAAVLGNVKVGDHSSIWYNAVVRGDIQSIAIGHHTNIQDNAVLHVADDLPCRVGNYVTVGHSAIIHAATVGDDTLVGMGAVILDGAVIGDQCLVGAKALVTQGTKIPNGSLVVGSPARVARPLTEVERKRLRVSAERYVLNAAYCLQHKVGC